MNSVKLSTIAFAVGLSSGIQQIDQVLKVADSLSYESVGKVYSRMNIADKPKVVNGFPSFSQEVDEIEFKIYRAVCYCYGFKLIQLNILCFDYNQAQRMASSFHSVINKQSLATPPNHSSFKMHLVDDPILPEDVIDDGSKDKVVYTMFFGQT